MRRRPPRPLPPRPPPPASPDARPVPRNLDALADLLREARVKRVVVTDWGMPEASIGGLLEVLADEGVELSR